MPISDRIAKELELRRSIGALRKLSFKSGLIDLCSNDYLGFAANGILEKYLPTSLDPHKGATGSRLLSGNTILAEETEQIAAAALQGEAALIFGSGYNANLGLFSALGTRDLTVLYDELIHASMRDGIRLGHSRAIKFTHNDLSDIEEKLSRTEGEKIVAVESVYSMDGDVAPLCDLAILCASHNAALIVDEAHATGVYGEDGAGLVVASGIAQSVFARVHTFGKALGAHGGVVIGNNQLREYLINFARPFIYSTAPSNTFYLGIQAGLAALKDSQPRRDRLWDLIGQFQDLVTASELISRCKPMSSPIQSLIIPGNSEARRISSALEDEGFDARPILSPTVPVGVERLRISLHSHNTPTEIARLVVALQRLLQDEIGMAANS